MTWGEGMLARQIDSPDDLTRHGALSCPACTHIHGRCMDAVYPFLHLAATTGQDKFLTGAIRVMEWAEHNVSQEDGSWTVVPDPKTWRGISVFGAIALGEALHFHGHVLPAELRQQWMERLSKAGEYVYRAFDLTFTNINYGFTGIYCLHLLGEVLDRPEFTQRSRKLATGASAFFTKPNALLFGEGKPSDAVSNKGLSAVDLGYNVEESLNGIVLYALREQDEALLGLLEKSLESHLEFMLPDGGWDNSWGTRQYKWSYWGSRTTDGSQPAFAMMVDRNPAFATAAVRTTELLAKCTAKNGLIYGGLHFETHDLPPCIHHTFCHAKPLAYLLDMKLPEQLENTIAPLPRSMDSGIKHFPEIDVWLLARGPWRATVSTYDFVYKKHALQGSGGSMTMLYHKKAGPLLAASMANYQMVERFNQQEDPDGEDFALTPRLEYMHGGWYTNLFDLQAKVSTADDGEEITVTAQGLLKDNNEQSPVAGVLPFTLDYRITKDRVSIRLLKSNNPGPDAPIFLVIPLLSASDELLTRRTEQRYSISKPNGELTFEANLPISTRNSKHNRVFNMVPGVEAVPFSIEIPPGFMDQVICQISFIDKP